MIFSNLWKIVRDHYQALSEESGYKPIISYLIIFVIFILFPVGFGVILASVVTIWSNFITTSATVFGVLTGFSINTLVLLLRYNEKEGYPIEKRTVQKTREFTLYTIFIGVVILLVLLFGYLFIQVSMNGIGDSDLEFELDVVFIISGIAYGLIIHYFLTILTITHRLWSLIHGGALSGQ